MLEELSDILHNEIAEVVIEGIWSKLKEAGLPTRLLFTPAEAAWMLHFTERAFLQSDWHKEITVTKIGIKNFYHIKDLEDFIVNHKMIRLRKLPGRAVA